LNDKLIQNEILYKNNLLSIIVDVSASTGAFVGTVCLIAVRCSVSGRTGCRRCGRVSVHRLVSLLPTTSCSPRNWAANGD